ncbi:ubiquitin carboxyl-terminal hydrolase 47 [Atheta coriaria]|uniref:ubiquitin carboxyl-terminal hydrolase 47 n=1 Tax=Dalotia coriaria TaxID=877792 RepID=UPI0031F3D35B
MVWPPNEPSIAATIEDRACKNHTVRFISLYPNTSVDTLIKEVEELLELTTPVTLTIERGGILLNDFTNMTLKDAGVSFDESVSTHRIIVEHANVISNPPNPPNPPRMAIMPPPANTAPSTSVQEWSSVPNYVGLVNQAMTCYLNSLLQVLYMTPEFRNALYNWEFDGNNPNNSIPFQLQRLFLNLQTSSKSSVETTSLTQSFGWNVQQAWEQHDIQELCRVMFDALEQKFKDTKQANLINDLYEGKMLDYVMCLECRTEKSREDTFQDIPLPVRPFGSTVAYNSVEEALRAFVQPETLDGNNQYFCEKCNKKCDAHKGLKFTKFPYLLTLHLKRFDFDYNSVSGHRIKLNDKVVFPETLNLNSFMSDLRTVSEETIEERESAVKSDDCSTTDSGSALDDESCQGTDVSSTTNGQDDNCADDDEGIDVSSENQQENEKNRLHEIQGPYMYELFSIMIHSGSASGGHYYAYIKDFDKKQWFCFNDQSVTSVTNEDIHKTYGGGPQRGYYSGAYSSSTNAYMLMYRQIDKERNCSALQVEEFPPHIEQLLKDMRESEETERKKKEEENDSTVVKVHCYHPEKLVMETKNVLVFFDTTLGDTVEEARYNFKLQDIVKSEDCRLVAYSSGSIECSLNSSTPIAEVVANYTEFLLEIKNPGTEFDDYQPDGVMMKTYIITLETEEVDGPFTTWVNHGDTVRDLQKALAIRYNLEAPHIVQETYSNPPRYLEDPNSTLKFATKCTGYKIYVSNALNLDYSDKPFAQSKLASVIDRFVHVISIKVSMPETDSNTLDILSIPSLDANQCLDRIEIGAGDRESNQSSLRVSPLPGPNSELFGDQSNSEDSSLSDSDRTLVGDAPGDNIGLLSSSSNSPADQHMASPTEGQEEDFPEYNCQMPQEEMNWDDETPSPTDRPPISYYMKAQLLESAYMIQDKTRCAKVLVDKRMTLGMFKKNIEPLVGVPMEYFKIYRTYPTQEYEWSTLTDKLGSLKDDDRLIVKLGRVLKENEVAFKVYHLQLEHPDSVNFLFEWVVSNDQTVAAAKKEILLQAKKQHMIDIPFNSCRLRKRYHDVPVRILLDDEKIGDLPMVNYELYIQRINGPERTSSQLSVFVRQWFPSKLSLSTFQEVNLELKTKEELKARISELADIPVEFLEVAHVMASFPCDRSVLEIHNQLNWNFVEENLTNYPINVYHDGFVFYYRDSREQLKELTREERIDLIAFENTRLGKYDKSSVKHRRERRQERGLKIYLDTSPKKDDDLC